MYIGQFPVRISDPLTLSLFSVLPPVLYYNHPMSAPLKVSSGNRSRLTETRSIRTRVCLVSDGHIGIFHGQAGG
jgi:hypothetical protein